MMRVLLLLMAFLTLAITSIMDETENKLGDSLFGITEIGKWESEDKEAHQLLSALYTYFKKMAPLTKNVDKLINKINDFETLKNSFFHRGI